MTPQRNPHVTFRREEKTENSGDIPLVVVQHTFPQPDKPFFQRGTPQWELHPEVRGRPPRGCLHQRAEGVVYLSHNTDL